MLFSLQYFTGSNGANFDGTVAPTVGGSLFSTDFCPFQDRFTVRKCNSSVCDMHDLSVSIMPVKN